MAGEVEIYDETNGNGSIRPVVLSMCFIQANHPLIDFVAYDRFVVAE